MTKKITSENTVLPFQLENADVRGRFGRLESVLDKILDQHDYPKPVEALITEASIITALVGQMLKLDWKLSLQIRGKGPIRLIATDYYGPTSDKATANIRAYASFDKEGIDTSVDPFSQIGDGYFAIIINQGSKKTPYQGITPLSGKSLSNCAENYFFQSEQIPTRFSVSYGQNLFSSGEHAWRGGGIMLQHLPSPSHRLDNLDQESSTSKIEGVKDIETENWSRVNILLDTVEDLELIGPNYSKELVLFRLFNEENLQTYSPESIYFGCTCSEEKVRQSMSIYSKKEIKHMTNEDGFLTADCQFCGTHYKLLPETLGFEAKK
ncbi:MAG: Hsp33 family molecular chaperone HslO [Paracoccaceae bacterium]